MIRRLAANGKTILISSHILSELAEMCDVVGIIEQGKMLAVGSVEEIHKKLATGAKTHTWVRVRVLGGADGLAAWLKHRGDIEQPRIQGEEALFAHDGDDESQAALLRDIVQAGFKVAAFGSQNKTLEEVFMQVTEGRVQ
jgi:ABC-2 type transport system ATP-binding protein